MGGNIQFTSMTRRYNRDEYFTLRDEVLELLWENVFDINPHDNKLNKNLTSLDGVKSKESFGDLDIICCSTHLKSDYIQVIVDKFNLKVGDWNKNGNVLSFSYKNLQIDLIVTQEEYYQTSIDYYKYSDSGNLIGRISHKMGIKFGHRGSEIIIKENDQVIGTLLLTQDTKRLLELLDLDYNVWENGFNTVEDIFIFVSNSKYFNKDIYLLDNRNHYSRTRDAKRKTYSDFLLWCNDKQFTNNYPYETITEKSGYNIRQPFYSELIVPNFPHVADEYDKIVAKHNTDKEFKQKFNGKIIMENTGLVDKELGMFMTYAKDIIDNNNLKSLIIKSTEHTVNLIIKSLFLHYQNKWGWAIPLHYAKQYLYGDDYLQIAPDINTNHTDES